MMLNKRQSLILEKIVKDYISLAQPISSQFLEKKHHLGLSPATIRIEMQKLAEDGYIYQPHTSAGRIPTDKGYRFFVDNLLNEELEYFKIDDWFEKRYEFDDPSKIVQFITKKIASISQALVIGYLKREEIFWKEGWEEVLKEPEFKEKETIINFIDFLKELEKEIEYLKTDSEINILIGKENRFKKGKEFSVIYSEYHFSRKEKGIISLIGPKRMNYDKNIRIMYSLMKVFE